MPGKATARQLRTIEPDRPEVRRRRQIPASITKRAVTDLGKEERAFPNTVGWATLAAEIETPRARYSGDLAGEGFGTCSSVPAARLKAPASISARAANRRGITIFPVPFPGLPIEMRGRSAAAYGCGRRRGHLQGKAAFKAVST